VIIVNANKIILNNEILIDLTQDTAIEEDVAEGKTFHKADGSVGVGIALVGPENLDDVLTEQETLIVELKATLNDKASGGGSGVECTLPHVIEVDELPTENIDTNAVYFCDGKYYKYVSSDVGDIWEEYILNDGGESLEQYLDQWTAYATNNLTEGVVPNLTAIPNYAYHGRFNLRNMIMPKVKRIGDNAFDGCERLALTELPSGLTYIGSSAFKGCVKLALTELPIGVTQISSYAFQGCENLALTKLPSGIARIYNYAFYGCTKLALTELPSGVTDILGVAFYNCQKLSGNLEISTGSIAKPLYWSYWSATAAASASPS
jgi:hypothetical protein